MLNTEILKFCIVECISLFSVAFNASKIRNFSPLLTPRLCNLILFCCDHVITGIILIMIPFLSLFAPLGKERYSSRTLESWLMIRSWLLLVPLLFNSCWKLRFIKAKFRRLFWSFYIAPVMWQCTFLSLALLSLPSPFSSTLHRLSPSSISPHKEDHRAVSILSSWSWRSWTHYQKEG